MLTLMPQADLGVMYEADCTRYRAAGANAMTDAVTKEVFMAFFAGCPSVGFRRDGVDIGGILYDGTQAHISVLPEHHGHWGLLLKPALEWLFSLNDEVLVDVERNNTACLRLMHHVGWRCVGERDDVFVFRLVPRQATRRTAHPAARRSDVQQRAALHLSGLKGP